MKAKIDSPNTFIQSTSVKWMAAGISLLVILILVGGIWVWPQNNLALTILLGAAIAGVVYFIAGRFMSNVDVWSKKCNRKTIKTMWQSADFHKLKRSKSIKILYDKKRFSVVSRYDHRHAHGPRAAQQAVVWPG